MVPIKKGDIVFNHEQSVELLKNGHISGRGKAYADGTVGDKFASGVFRPLQPGDHMYELLQKMNEHLAETGEDVNSFLTPINAMHTNMEQMANAVNTINNINNTNNKTQQIVQQITLNCPNVTNNSGIEYIQKELGHLALRAEQEAMKR